MKNEHKDELSELKYAIFLALDVLILLFPLFIFDINTNEYTPSTYTYWGYILFVAIFNAWVYKKHIKKYDLKEWVHEQLNKI